MRRAWRGDRSQGGRRRGIAAGHAPEALNGATGCAHDRSRFRGQGRVLTTVDRAAAAAHDRDRRHGVAAHLRHRVRHLGTRGRVARYRTRDGRGRRLRHHQVTGQARLRRFQDPHLLDGVAVEADAPACHIARTDVATPQVDPGRFRDARPDPRHGVAASAAPEPVIDEDGPIAIAERTPADVVPARRPGDPGRRPGRARDPVPTQRGRESPAAVVGDGPAPRFVRHPGPTEGGPDPATVGVGLPSRRDIGPPHVADLGLVVPGAVAIELVRVGGDVVGERLLTVDRVRGLLLPAGVPVRELVAFGAIEGRRPFFDFAAPRVHPIPRAQAHGLRAVQAGLALVDGDAGLSGVHVDADDAAVAGGDHSAGGLHLEGAVAAVTEVEEQGARPQAQHGALVAALVVGDVVELGRAVEAQEGAAGELELRAAAAVGPDTVAGQEGQVGRGLFRARLGGALDAHALFHVSDAPMTVRLREHGRRHGQREHGQNAQAAHRSSPHLTFVPHDGVHGGSHPIAPPVPEAGGSGSRRTSMARQRLSRASRVASNSGRIITGVPSMKTSDPAREGSNIRAPASPWPTH